MPDPVREFIRAFNERDLDAFVAVLDPGGRAARDAGAAQGASRRRGSGRRGAPGGVQQTIELEQLYEDGTEGGGGARWR